MSLITLSDYIRTNLGAPVGGIRVRAFALAADGTIGASHVAETFTNSSTGEWELVNLNTELSPTGIFAIETYNPSTSESRWRFGDIRLQVGFLTGPNGEIPVNDGAVTGNKIADGAISDAKIGTRTVDQNLATPGNIGTITQMLSWIVGRLKAITGAADWKTAPATTLATAASHISNTSNPHAVTALQVQAVKNGGTVTEIRSGADASKGSGSAGIVYFATDTGKIYRHSGSAWVKLGVTSYNDLDDKPAATSQSSDFGRVKVGTTTLVADQVGDTLELVAGSGIALSPDSSLDRVTISSTMSGTPGAHTHSGSDINGRVDDSDDLKGVDGTRFPYIGTNTGFANSGFSLNSTQLKMLAGSSTVSVSGGNGTVDVPVTVTGYATIVATNGDFDAYNNAINLKDSYAGSDSRFTIKCATSFSGTVRVNYVIFYW